MNKAFNYRPEIDGLRAIAVLPVIFFHAGLSLFEGGFVGVDVFFVISGYLITSIILKERKEKKFTILNFYERRIRRILPALFFVMFICLPFAWFWLLPKDLEDFIGSVIAASTFWSNFLFFSENGYFATKSELKPLLHTWSLAIEEQFYIVYPVLLTFFLRFKKKFFVKFLIFIAVLSLFMAQWSGNFKFTSPFIEKEILFFSQSSLASFFLPMGRIWELIVGAIVAFHIDERGQPKKFNESLSIFGFLLITYSVFNFSHDTPFPSFYTIIPTTGVALIILFTKHDTIIYKLLSIKSLVFLGLISYSAYLYHYPLFVFARHINFGQPSTILMLALSIFAFIFAYFSWKYIEKPFRNNKIVSKKILWSSLFIAYSLFAFVGVANYFGKGFEFRFYDIKKTYPNIVLDNAQLHQQRTDYANQHGLIDLREKQDFSDNVNKHKILIIGDSRALDLALIFNQSSRLFENYEFKKYYIKIENFLQHTKKHNLEVDKLINTELFKKADIILTSALYSSYSFNFNVNPIDQLSIIGKKYDKIIAITGVNPIFVSRSDPVIDIFLKHKERKLEKKEIDFLLYTLLDTQFDSLNDKIKSTSNKLGLLYLEKHDYACNFEVKSCLSTTDSGEKIYLDGIHYSLDGAKFLGKMIYEINWLKPITKKINKH